MSQHPDSLAGLAAAWAATPATDIDIPAVVQRLVTAGLAGAVDTKTQ